MLRSWNTHGDAQSARLSCKRSCNETHSVNEGHIGQQCLRTTCNAIWSLNCVKFIQKPHCMLNLHFDIGEEPQAVIYKLNIRVNSSHMGSKKGPTSLSWRDRLGCAPSLRHASSHTPFANSSCMSGVGNASLQLRKHRYRDRAVLVTREEISSNRWAVSDSHIR